MGNFLPKVVIILQRIISITIYVFIMASHLYGQETAQDIKDLQQQLHSIQTEIERFEKQIKTTDNKLRIETKSIEGLDRQINLVSEKIRLYNLEISKKKKQVSLLETQIDSLKEKMNQFIETFKKQMIFAYKYKRGKHLDWILGSSNFNEALIRYSHFQKIAILEKDSFMKLKQLQNKLQSNEEELKSALFTLNDLLNSSKKENQILQQKRMMKAHLIKKINKDKSLLLLALNDKKRSYDQILELITTLEKKQSRRKLETAVRIEWEKLSGNFAKNKARLNWPAEGKLLHSFGRYKNPKLNTILNNTGIDIRANRGSHVRSVFPGVVSLITYLSGFGNTIIIDHNDGYYTVYSHLEEITVKPGDFVEAGHIVGTVGESGSLEGAKLHFEIYGNNKPLNPLSWLKKMD